MKNILHEIHQRSLWQVLGIYLATSWLVLQVVDTLNSTLGIPAAVIRASFVLLAIGLPIIMITAFVQKGWGRRADTDLETTAVRRRRRLFSWRNAILGGVGAFTLLGMGTAAWLIMRTAGIGPAGTLVAKGILDERSTVLLSEFASSDPGLARLATEALRVDLSQSKALRLADPARIREALGRMEREPDVTLDLGLARELAEREGIAAVIGGEINGGGGRYLLSAAVVVPSSGEVLTSRRETAADSTEIIPAIDRLSRGLRERIGESLREISASPPLERVTTDNLEALRKFSQGARLSQVGGSSEQSRALFEEAVALDSGFAMAWRAIGVDLRNLNQEPAQMVKAFRHAMDHEERLTESERYRVRAIYFESVTGEYEKSVRELEKLVEQNPDDPRALNGLGVAYANLRDFPRAEQYFRRSIAASLDAWNPYYNTVEVLGNLGRFEEADALLDSARALFPGSPPVEWTAAQLDATRERYREAEQRHLSLLGEMTGSPMILALLESDLVSMVAVQGRLSDAEAHVARAMEANASQGAGGEYIEDAVQGAWIDLLLREDAGAARARVERALERYPLSSMEALDRPYLGLAELYARTGDPGRARSLLGEFEAEVPPELRGKIQTNLERARGELALAEGDVPEALAAFHRSDRGYCILCPLPGLALALEQAGQPDSAIAALERYATTPWFLRFYGEEYGLGALMGPTYEQLAVLYDETGDADRAALYYARLVELWEDADPELQPRVETAQRRLEEILAARG